MEEMTLTASSCTVGDILGTLGPYAQDYIRPDGLGIHATSFSGFVSIQVSNISSVTSSVAGPVQKVTFTAIHQEELSASAEDEVCISLVAHTLGEHVVYFGGNLSIDNIERTVAAMTKLQEIHLDCPLLDHRFLRQDLSGPLPNEKLFPSLRHLHPKDTLLYNGDWSPIIPYLTHQTSGGQRISLTISGTPQHACKEVLRDMKGLVEELVLDLVSDDDCPLDYCWISEEEV
jgi:hypothetical protein